MLDEKEVSDILNELVNEDKLTVREDLIYFYKEVERKTPLPLFFEYREKEEIGMDQCFNVLDKLAKSKFRSRFKLRTKELKYTKYYL